ncbi:2-amino-4-hydroxy-6-hydroxymethyldihydropteridine diphosphokinase [Rhizobium oryziradicis]|uniref:2-amino-4-hydroxy-6-hydroxymethyldihydropteridine pyrophosphokinase n=1 Tax=Rhizobium oryziradicis TaxID=1867956 RepID=A0A1Q8ZP65_9HYPH|nr:2-amino-4-hydroxy-6-hydroxymethyldihydropteridine diphosphokinase [Rhizobium oryziradicis]
MLRFPLTTINECCAATAALGLGGNIGDPALTMALALKALNERGDCAVFAVSGLYRTPPWGKLDQADFFNCCALVKTTLPPAQLLDACLGLERSMKRVRKERWGPRTLDIDILLYDDQVVAEPHLSVPHPRMLERAFVLQPLADIAAEWIVSGKSVAQWLEGVETTDITQVNAKADWWKKADT